MATTAGRTGGYAELALAEAAGARVVGAADGEEKAAAASAFGADVAVGSRPDAVADRT